MRIAHLSDLHFGAHDEGLAAGLAEEVNARGPGLVVVSGDFTQVGSQAEFHAARTFIDTLTAPVFAVPGNHDIPERQLLRRFLDPYGLYRQFINPDLEPFIVMEGIALGGIKTTRRMRLELDWSHGSISRGQLDTLHGRFDTARVHTVRIVVAHHPLLVPEGPMTVPLRRVDRADRALARFANMGVRMVLSGHFHLSYVRQHGHRGEIAEGEPAGPRRAAVAPILVAQASSAISTRRRGEANAYNVIDIIQGDIAVRVREWDGFMWRYRPGHEPPLER
jgi:3',5'-cyclic AMP phosphodiesterase CpdA